MTRYIRLSGANFTKSALPKVINFSDEILALPSLKSWFVASGSYVDYDSEGRVATWLDRQGATTFTPLPAAPFGPELIKSLNGLPALKFESSNGQQTPMIWSSLLNLADYTKVIIASYDELNAGNTMLLAYRGDGSDGQHALRMEGSTLSSWADETTVGGTSSINVTDSLLSPAIYASAFSEAEQLNSVMANGDVITVATPGAAQVTQGDVVISGSTQYLGIDNAPLTVYDVLFFDKDILSSSSSKERDLLMRYARSKLGIKNL